METEDSPSGVFGACGCCLWRVACVHLGERAVLSCALTWFVGSSSSSEMAGKVGGPLYVWSATEVEKERIKVWKCSSRLFLGWGVVCKLMYVDSFAQSVRYSPFDFPRGLVSSSLPLILELC